MTKQETKNDKFKANAIIRKGVRPFHSSVKTFVMKVERREWQNSRHKLNFHSGNNTGTNGKRLWKGKSWIDRWLRPSLRTQRYSTEVFNNLLLHINEETLKEAYDELDGTKASGVDGITKSAYGRDLQTNLEDLALRIKRGSYKPRPKREGLIPKANGKTRPIAVACFEDKLVDAVIMKILSSIYDSSFIRNSFGFRPKKSAHQAIVASYRALKKGERPYVVEVDFSNFFNTIPHEKLLEVLRGRVADDAFFPFQGEASIRTISQRLQKPGGVPRIDCQ